MNIELYNKVSLENSKRLTKAYSTSFSIAIRLLAPGIRDGIYGIYGFVRLADEIVDTFHNYDKQLLLDNFELEVNHALENKISLNPVLQSFQLTFHKYDLGRDLVDAFLKSMKLDLHKSTYNKEEYLSYIYGSADVVGLMCLKIFVEGDEKEYERLKKPAMSLGSAFQKVNFLRDIRNDYENLARTYFPGIDLLNFSSSDKEKIIAEIKSDFTTAYAGIKELPKKAQLGVYIAYVYYYKLLKKLERTPPSEIMHRRIRIPNYRKVSLVAYGWCSHKILFR
ncbi:MAG: phytoene/squalene synthase family protein [Bacteroidota bacterium]